MPRPIPADYDKRDALYADAAGEVQLRPLELREASSDLGPGYDAHQLTWLTVDTYGTAFQRGAAKKSVSERIKEIPVLWQHWGENIIGRHAEIKEDKTGLFVRTVISETTLGKDVMTLMRDEVPIGHSFGFQTVQDRSAKDDDALDFSVAPEWVKRLPRNEIRVITEFVYWESSAVTFAANRKAKTTNVRSILDADDLPSLLAAIRSNQLDAERLDCVGQIVAAWNERAGAAATQHSTPDEARRDREAFIRQTALACGLTVEQLLCVA